MTTNNIGNMPYSKVQEFTNILDIAVFAEVLVYFSQTVVYPGICSSGEVQQIQLRTEDREYGDLGAAAP